MSVKTDKMVTSSFLCSCSVSYTGTKYVPVTHSDVIITIGNFIQQQNLRIRSERYMAGSNGQKAVGVLGIESIDQELDFMVAWKNSLDGSMAFKLAFGAQVRVCSNGMMHGDTGNFKRKHVGEAPEEIEEHIQYAIQHMNETMKVQTDVKELYKQIPINQRKSAELLGRLYFVEEGLTATQLSVVKKEMENPSFNYGAPGSVWELYNHCTHAIKNAHPLDWHRQHEAVADLFNIEFGV